MAENWEGFDTNTGSDGARIDSKIDAELRTLTDALFEQTITLEQRQRLEQLVISDIAIAEVYLELVYEWGNLPNYLAPSMVDLDEAGRKTHLSSVLQMNETMILPALRAQQFEEEVPLQFPSQPAVAPAGPTNRFRRWIALASAAAVLLAVMGGLWLFRSEPAKPPVAIHVPPVMPPDVVVIPPATVTAIASRGPRKTGGVTVGTTFVDGQAVEVPDGAVELTFASGAKVVVESPARFRIIDRNAMALEDGLLAAHVPPPAVGFRVVSPGLLAVDHGTDFGIRSSMGKSSSEVHIFGGAVDVTGTDAHGRTNSTPIRAITGNAFRHESTDASAPVSVPFAPQTFNRDISAIRVAIALRNTGDELDEGTADSKWRIESAPKELFWTPQAAFVVKNPIYSQVMPNSARCKWISTDAVGTFMPAGIFVFSTSVDLTGLNPATVQIEAVVCADNSIEDVRINGKPTGLNTSEIKTVDLVDFKSKALQFPNSVWKEGINQIEFVVRNEPTTDNRPSPMGLQLQWSGTACTSVERKNP